MSKPGILLLKAVLLTKYAFKIEGQLIDLGMNSQKRKEKNSSKYQPCRLLNTKGIS